MRFRVAASVGAVANDGTVSKAQAHAPVSRFRIKIPSQIFSAIVAIYVGRIHALLAETLCLDSLPLEIFIVGAPEIGNGAAGAEFDDARGESADEFAIV
jgi:hypothetical protein